MSSTMAGMARERLQASDLAALLGDWSGGGGSLARQLATAIRSLVEAGLLAEGTVLPPERQLAQSLAVSRSTLVTALDQLRSEGVVSSRQGSGSVIEARSVRSVPAAEPRVLGTLLRAQHGIDLSAAAPWGASHLPPIQLDLDHLLAADPAHGYGPKGMLALRTLLAARYVGMGVPTATEEIQVTNGAQHALYLTLKAVAAPGSTVVVERPTFPGLLDALHELGLRPVPVPRTSGDLDPDLLRRALGQARVAYLQPLLANPTGVAAGERAMGRLAEVLDDWGGTVIDDATHADLRFDGTRPVGLEGRCRAATVVSVGSLSKVAWAGLRIGWLRAPASLVERIAQQRHASDLGTSQPSQILAVQLLEHLDDVAVKRREALRASSTFVMELLAERLPDWSVLPPDGGCAVWVTLPGPDSMPFVQRVQRAGVFLAPGSAADPLAEPSPSIRMSVDRPRVQLETAVERMAEAWQAMVRS